jgi:hypothetical protein
MGAIYTAQFRCDAPGCFAGDRESVQASTTIGLATVEWAKKEREGWVYVEGRYYCPKCREYPHIIHSKQKVNPDHMREVGRMAFEGDVLA